MNKSINLELSIDETNTILDALGQLPFVKVYGLIGKIQQQAQVQLSTPSEPEGAEAPTPIAHVGG